MTLLRWQPFNDMLRMQESINQVFRKHFDEMNQQNDSQQNCWNPTADIFDNEKDFLIRLELPGIKKEEVKIDFNDNILSVSGERKPDASLSQEKFHRMECLYGKFNRSFTLPQHIDAEKIEGTLREGILNIRIPKSEKAQKKSIPIQAE